VESNGSVLGRLESLQRFWYGASRQWWRAFLRRSAKVNKYRLHRLVTEAFVLPKPGRKKLSDDLIAQAAEKAAGARKSIDDGRRISCL
jgi:hypothetical protein